jgi:hypothetical protein
MSSTAALVAISALLAAPALAEGQPAQNAGPAAETGANPSAQGGQENRKTSGTNDQAGPSSATPSADQNSQGDKATHSVSGRGGKEEPGSHAPTQAQGEQPSPALANGAWNVPGAPADSQTVPAKFSQRNDMIDKTPIMAMPLGLSDQQKRAIAEAVKRADAPVAQVKSKPAEELPWGVTIHDLPNASTDPSLPDVKYVRTPDGILLVRPSNRIVVDEIKG